jgi:hypothetical protein
MDHENEEFVGEFFIKDTVFHSLVLSEDVCAKVLVFARSYARQMKKGMEKKKRFLFFPFRTGTKVDKDASIQVYVSALPSGVWTVILQLVVERYDNSFFSVNRTAGLVLTGISVVKSGSQWVLR